MSVKYMCLLVGTGDIQGPTPGSAEFDQMLAEYGTVTQAMVEAGVFVHGDPLEPAATATTVRVRDGERLLTDGPFAEIKEQLGGYYVLDCPDLDSALEWASKIPAARFGAVEVRPISAITEAATR